MGSFAKLAKRAVETDAPVMVKVMDGRAGPILPRQNRILLPISQVLFGEIFLVPFFRYKNCFEGPRM